MKLGNSGLDPANHQPQSAADLARQKVLAVYSSAVKNLKKKSPSTPEQNYPSVNIENDLQTEDAVAASELDYSPASGQTSASYQPTFSSQDIQQTPIITSNSQNQSPQAYATFSSSYQTPSATPSMPSGTSFDPSTRSLQPQQPTSTQFSNNIGHGFTDSTNNYTNSSNENYISSDEIHSPSGETYSPSSGVYNSSHQNTYGGYKPHQPHSPISPSQTQTPDQTQYNNYGQNPAVNANSYTYDTQISTPYSNDQSFSTNYGYTNTETLDNNTSADQTSSPQTEDTTVYDSRSITSHQTYSDSTPAPTNSQTNSPTPALSSLNSDGQSNQSNQNDENNQTDQNNYDSQTTNDDNDTDQPTRLVSTVKKTSSEPIVATEWKKYHAAWQNYYQNYYSDYYAKAAQTYLATEKLKDERIAEGEVNRTRRFKRLIPVIVIVFIILTGLFLQYNRLIFAPVMAYISPSSSDVPTSLTAVDPTVSQTVSPEPRLIIPKINVDVPVAFNIPLSEVDAAMNEGVAHFSIAGANAMPGQIGNLVISGHSAGDIYSDNPYKFIFSGLERLSVGDLIYINYQSVRYTYQITGDEVVEPTNVAALIYPTDKPILTLITCTPLGTSRYRLLVTAEQISPAYDQSNTSESNPVNEGSDDASMPANEPSFFESIFR